MPALNYSKLVPPDTFIGRFMQAMSCVETAAAYDFWAAVWALGSVTGRGVYVPRPYAPVHMNWYVILAAESGVTRKSTAVRAARDVVTHVMGSDHMHEGRATPESMFDRLSMTPHVNIAVSELATFLGRESYVIELPALLTDLYDCPTERRASTVSKGARVIHNAFVTFLSASTPSWLRMSVNPTVVEGGFTSRCLFIHDERPKGRVAWPDSAVEPAALADVLRETQAQTDGVTEIHLLPAGMKRFTNWYKSRDVSSVVPFIASFNSREDSHVLRLAATLAINDGTLAISKTHVDIAVKCIAAAKAGAVQLFTETASTRRAAQGIDRVIKLLVEAGPVGMRHTKLYAGVRNYLSREEFNILMDIMHETGMVSRFVTNKDGAGRRGTHYIRDKGLSNTRLVQEARQLFM